MKEISEALEKGRRCYIGFRLRASTKKLLEKHAKKKNRNLSDCCRTIVETYLEEMEGK